MPKVKDFREKVQPATSKSLKEKRNRSMAEGEDLNLQADIAESQMDLDESQPVRDEAESESFSRPSSARRRPGLENRTVEAETQVQIESEPSASKFEEASEASSSSHKRKVQIDFYGKEWLEAKAPRALRSMEIIAEDWVNDGRFEGLPLGHPLMQMLASKSLQKAKQVEKKLEEKGVFFIAKTGIELVKSKVESLRKKDQS